MVGLFGRLSGLRVQATDYFWQEVGLWASWQGFYCLSGEGELGLVSLIFEVCSGGHIG